MPSRPRTRRTRRRIVLVAVSIALAVVLADVPPAQGAPSGPPLAATSTERRAGGYRPPVPGTIVDRFRPPPHPYGAGNRGLDYRTVARSAVRAANDGEVIFAGQVGGGLHVTIRHPDGLRTSYSFLAIVLVQRGQRVRGGDVIAETGELFHFGVRDPAGTYLDPELLFGGVIEVHLVPSGDDGAPPGAPDSSTEPVALAAIVRERLGPLSALVPRRGIAPRVPSDVLHRLRIVGHYATELRPETHAWRITHAIDAWRRRAADCTDPAVPPTRPRGRRIVVEVAGIGSTSEQASVTKLDAGGLGYAPGDVVRFSYGGGRVPALAPGSPLVGVPATTYGARESQNDLLLSADRLAALLREVARAAPGVPIDVVAHSQGGVVARLALQSGASAGTVPSDVRTLVTIGTPHEGANAATAVDAVAGDPGGRRDLALARQAIGLELDPDLPSGRQLSQVSPVIDLMRSRPLRPHVRLTSIGASGDLVVPAGRTATGDPTAHEVVLGLTGLHAHDQLPGTPETTREVALAISGRPPTCRTLAQVSADLALSEGISWIEDVGSAGAAGFETSSPP